jgi:hypothetical protein
MEEFAGEIGDMAGKPEGFFGPVGVADKGDTFRLGDGELDFFKESGRVGEIIPAIIEE